MKSYKSIGKKAGTRLADRAIHVFLLFSLLILASASDKPDKAERCAPANFAFSPGEEIEYTVYYNWGFIWVNAGRVTFNVFEKDYRNRPVYHFDSYGTTHRKYDWIFKVRDRFQSYVDKETFRPLWYEMDTYEGGFEARDVYNFFPEKNLVITTTENSDRPRQTDTIKIEPCSFDVLTAVYVARNLDFTGYAINEPIPFNILIGNKLFDLSPRYLGKETITTREGEKFDCIKFSVELVEGFIFTSGNDMFVWVTDDENRVPVLVEAQIRIGSVKAMLHSYRGLRNPETARIDR
jgi:hypothetical protein